MTDFLLDDANQIQFDSSWFKPIQVDSKELIQVGSNSMTFYQPSDLVEEERDTCENDKHTYARLRLRKERPKWLKIMAG